MFENSSISSFGHSQPDISLVNPHMTFLRTKQNVFQIAYPCLQREGRERGIKTESLHFCVAKCGCQQLKTFLEGHWLQIIGYHPLIKIKKSARCYLCMQILTANLRRTKQKQILCAVNLCPGMMDFTIQIFLRHRNLIDDETVSQEISRPPSFMLWTNFRLKDGESQLRRLMIIHLPSLCSKHRHQPLLMQET